jgi:hypothetical protein
VRAGAFLITCALLQARAAATAAEQPICADAPGKASETCTVPAGHIQIEANLADWTLAKAGGERDTELLLGDTNVKFGIDDRSDIGIELTPWVRLTSSADGHHESASGFGDIGIAYKHRLSPTDAPLQVTAFPFVKIPTAKRPLGNREWEAGLIVPVVYAIGHSPFSINLSPELDRAADGDRNGHHWAMAQVASFGWQATEKLSLSAEIWGQWDWDPDGTSRQATFDPSFAYVPRSDLQIAGGANFGLNKVTPDVEFYAGVAKRF